MRILCLDTTRKSAMIFLVDNDKNLIKVLDKNEKQSENLMINIDNILKENNVELNTIDCFGIVEGPGSFTGIRVGMATIKAMAFALNKPIISFNVFEVLSNHIKSGTILSECTSNSLYYCEIEDYKIKNVGVEEKIDADSLSKYNNKIMIREELFNDDEAYKYNVLILNDYTDFVFKQLRSDFDNQRFTSSPEPYYVQLSQAERNLENKKND